MTAQLPEAIYTIGVYGFSEDGFFDALRAHEIDLFIDIRMRRGMRGGRYKFVNSTYLQDKLAQMDIGYAHLKELAPTKRIIGLQNEADREARLKLRSDRTELCTAYKHEYKRDILKVWRRLPERKFYADKALAQVRQLADIAADAPIRRPVLFCVEGEPSACHRSLAAAEIARQLDLEVIHITAG